VVGDRPVPANLRMSLWSLRRHRALQFAVNGEPVRKGRSGSRAAIRLQRQVMDQMDAWRRFPMTGPVALDLIFRSVHRGPPAIHNAAKHALDALGPTIAGNVRPRRRHVLYRDDRQVKFLYVDLDQGWAREAPAREPGTGRVYITARRARDVAADMRAALLVSQEDDDDLDADCPFDAPELPDEPDLGWPGIPAPMLTEFHRWVDDDIRFRYIADLQEAILAGTDSMLASGLAGFLSRMDNHGANEQIAAILADAQAESRDVLLSSPLTLPLPHLPHVAGQGAAFGQQIRAQIQEFRNRWPLFTSLLVPVTLTFLVTPPAQGKDLDNIALTAIPIANYVLQPHIAPHLLAPRYPGRNPDPVHQQRLDRLRSVNARSVMAFQAIELPRSSADPPEGSLRAALGLHQHESWWERASDYLDKRMEQADQNGDLGSELWDEVFSAW
jgi:hypothetical protein